MSLSPLTGNTHLHKFHHRNVSIAVLVKAVETFFYLFRLNPLGLAFQMETEKHLLVMCIVSIKGILHPNHFFCLNLKTIKTF